MLQELNSQFIRLEEQRNSLLLRLGGIDQHLWFKKPTDRDWSISEIAHHLVLCEQEVLHQIHNRKSYQDNRRNFRDTIGMALVHFAFNYGLRVKVPMKSVVPQGRYAFNDIKEAWKRARRELHDYLSTVNNDCYDEIVFRHPVAGSMNICQTLDLIGLHISHHIRQIDRTERAVSPSP